MAVNPEPETVFRPLSGSRAFEEVVDQITYAIRSGRYPIGSRLPTVDELATLLACSRPTVSDAVRLLADAGVLEVKRGATGGISVLSGVVPRDLLRVSSRRNARTLTELVEARRPIEMELTRLATERADEEDFERMREANELLVGSKPSTREWSLANNLFHYAIGRAAQSPLLALFQHDVLEEMAVLLDGWDAKYTDPERTVREHLETYEAIRSGSVEAALAAMDGQLGELEELAPTFDRGARRRRPAGRPQRKVGRR